MNGFEILNPSYEIRFKPILWSGYILALITGYIFLMTAVDMPTRFNLITI